MKRIVLIDDEPAARKSLRTLLATYCPDVEIAGEADGVRNGVHLIRQERPQAVLLDISMKDGSGFDLLDLFPDLEFKVIFTTAHDQFALQAFRYSALDYLLKPVSPKELAAAIARLREEPSESHVLKIRNLLSDSRQRHPARIALSSQEGLVFLRLDQIIRLHSDGNYTTFYLQNGERHMVTRTIKDFEDMLPGEAFFRIHQSHIVQMAFVKKIMKDDGDYVVMEDGTQLPIARRRKEEFIEYAKKHL